MNILMMCSKRRQVMVQMEMTKNETDSDMDPRLMQLGIWAQRMTEGEYYIEKHNKGRLFQQVTKIRA